MNTFTKTTLLIEKNYTKYLFAEIYKRPYNIFIISFGYALMVITFLQIVNAINIYVEDSFLLLALNIFLMISPVLKVLNAKKLHYSKPSLHSNFHIKMIQKLLLLIFIAWILQGCKVGISEWRKNDSIDKDKKEQIKILNDKLFKAISSNNIAGVKALMSDELIKAGSRHIDTIISQISTNSDADTYTILDEYYVQNSTTGIPHTIPSGFSGDNDYTINYKVSSKEEYVSLLLLNGSRGEVLITVIFGKYGNQWKINIFHVGLYTLFKKTAPDYYKLAKASYDKSYLIDAVNYVSISAQGIRPVQELFQYKKEKEINEFYDKVMKEVNSKFQFPLALEKVNTKPKVFRIYPLITDEGIFPMVYYLSDINLDDTAALKIENEKVKKEVDLLFIGINEDKKYVYYKAFNELPVGEKPTVCYGFTDKQTK